MLPSLGGLSLRPAPARTGEFVTLKREEADERNARGEVEPVSHDEYVPSRELPDGHEYFGVRFPYQKPDHTYDSTVYDAETLWRWVKDRYTLPHNRVLIWREDWMALHERYDPDGPVPPGVALLPSLADGVIAYEGTGDQRRLVRIEFPDGNVQHYEGPKGEERLVRDEYPDGQVEHYEGAKGEERRVRAVFPTGDVSYFEGPMDEERVVRAESPNGNAYYEGSEGEERVVRVEYPDGNAYYEGSKGEERIVRFVDPDGNVAYYEGPKDEEHVVRKEYADGRVETVSEW